MIASLPMYDWPEQSKHWDTLWAAIRTQLCRRGVDAPDTLSRGEEPSIGWLSGDLVLSQTCSLPYRTRYHPYVTLVGTLDHGLAGCPPGYYNSVIVARKGGVETLEEAAHGTLAYNQPDSQSGWAAIHDALGSRGLVLRSAILSGSHRESARLVAEGAADFAALDAETWRLIETHAPHTADKLNVLEHTKPTPGLPLISRVAVEPAVFLDAISAAIEAIGSTTRDALHIVGIVKIPARAYRELPVPPAPPPARAEN